MVGPLGRHLWGMGDHENLTVFSKPGQPATHCVCGCPTYAPVDFVKDHCDAAVCPGQAYLQRQQEPGQLTT